MIGVREKRDWMKEQMNEWNRRSVKNRSGVERGKSWAWENHIDKSIKNSSRMKNGAREFSIDFDRPIRGGPKAQLDA